MTDAAVNQSPAAGEQTAEARVRGDPDPATITTDVFVLSPRAYLMLFITRGRGWRRWLVGYSARVLIVAALLGYFTESWRTAGRALLVLGGTAVVLLALTFVGGWLWVRRAARRGKCVRFEPVYYTLDEESLTLHRAGHGSEDACSVLPLYRVQKMVRTQDYCLMYVEHGLFHCVPLGAFGSEHALKRCEGWFIAADVPVRRLR